MTTIPIQPARFNSDQAPRLDGYGYSIFSAEGSTANATGFRPWQLQGHNDPEPDDKFYFTDDDEAAWIDCVQRSNEGDHNCRAALIFLRDLSLGEFVDIVKTAFPKTGPIDMRPLQGDLFNGSSL